MLRLEGEFPFVASLVIYKDDGTWGCMGSLVEPDVVLTAAHCVESYNRISVYVDRKRQEFSEVETYSGDLAKIFLDEPVLDVDPVSFHTDVERGDIGVSVDSRYKVPVEVHGTGNMIRAGSPEGYVVKGDSGGPLLFWTLKGWAQAGVVSGTHSSGWGLYSNVSRLPREGDDPDPTPPPPVKPPMPPKPPLDPVDYDRMFKENAEASSSIHIDCAIFPRGNLSRCVLKWLPRLADERKYRDAPYLIGCHSRDEFGEPIAGSGARWTGRIPNYYSVVSVPLNWDNEKIPKFESARSVKCSVEVDGNRWVVQ